MPWSGLLPSDQLQHADVLPAHGDQIGAPVESGGAGGIEAAEAGEERVAVEAGPVAFARFVHQARQRQGHQGRLDYRKAGGECGRGGGGQRVRQRLYQEQPGFFRQFVIGEKARLGEIQTLCPCLHEFTDIVQADFAACHQEGGEIFPFSGTERAGFTVEEGNLQTA